MSKIKASNIPEYPSFNNHYQNVVFLKRFFVEKMIDFNYTIYFFSQNGLI